MSNLVQVELSHPSLEKVEVEASNHRVIIAGTRSGRTYEELYRAVLEAVHEYGSIGVVLSGRCRGVGQLGEWFVANHHLLLECYLADWTRHNAKMVARASMLIALPSETSRGTWDVVRKAKRAGLAVNVARVAGGVDETKQGVDPLTYAALVHGEV